MFISQVHINEGNDYVMNVWLDAASWLAQFFRCFFFFFFLDSATWGFRFPT
jgi:hypothetical protein